MKINKSLSFCLTSNTSELHAGDSCLTMSLCVEGSHESRGVPISRNGEGRQDFFDLGEVLVSQVDNLSVLLDSVRIGRPGDRDDLGHARSLGNSQEPVDGDLAGGATLLVRQLLDFVDEFKVRVEVFTLKAWAGLSPVSLRDIIGGLERACESASSQWSFEKHVSESSGRKGRETRSMQGQ